ncbi:hypothetical protein U5A82_05630 [Sphingobium sp. CR2-8]|uniref:hypothetical protein n=1 Tax=Sphingobium sp. CR2-8 TaxID=1306534 RepID=UPI002DBE967F|nr:hypothetical protein [Sphingobium sp. CR2-8]MEC3909971.1 hypothetical protein [Sphingobium sp. CR2-8]
MTSADHHFGPSNLIRNQGIGNRQDDPLPRLLSQLLDKAGQPAMIERAVSRPWASALFEGRRHIIRLRMSGDDFPNRGTAFMRDVEDAEWSLPGHFVADVHIDDGDANDEGVWLELSVLTIRDW